MQVLLSVKLNNQNPKVKKQQQSQTKYLQHNIKIKNNHYPKNLAQHLTNLTMKC